MNADMIAAIDGEPRDAVECVPVWFSLPDEVKGEDVTDEDGLTKPGTCTKIHRLTKLQHWCVRTTRSVTLVKSSVTLLRGRSPVLHVRVRSGL